ncbi:PEP/pyruvate-binding domain-containing protein [Kribbella sp. CA-293567]|uniref:PEP/pyruvate-binding domain-containing protein n=1 Tax=Kribbella sp. CA-293567 TaxID=3002436 RepID=UPI0022DE3C95|nr:PEP/pyruvate-binding domain-containing protein [Kribbella sp. CA-293567]WBQ05559.1 PEP-utilizing enzyme [Kribbella sp. CA-293567]
MIIRLTEATPQNAGAKAAVLGGLSRAGFSVPPAFVIPVAAYRAATAHLDLPRALTSQNPDEARLLVEAQPVPAQLLDHLSKALAALGNTPVAVRSSATTEDTPTASAAGQHDTYLGIQGLPNLTAKIQAIWASLWSPRAIAYRAGLSGDPRREAPGIAVLIQRHLDAEVAGVLFTADPRGNPDTAVLEASWGLGESVVQGSVTPDTYVLTSTGALNRTLGTKQTRRDRLTTPASTAAHAGTSGIATTEVPLAQQQQLCLTDEQAHRIIQLGQRTADLMGEPQDIEFALENNHIWLLQSRPITAPLDPTSSSAATDSDGAATGSGESVAADLDVLRGVGGSAGVAVGPARIVNGVEDFGRVEQGDILVCRFTDPGWTPLFSCVAGVVTEVGGRLSHAAIVAREHRVPAVLGVVDAMRALRDNQRIRIDGSTGLVEPVPPS